MNEIIIKSECVSCNKPIEEGQQFLCKGIGTYQYGGYLSMNPGKQIYHEDCYELRFCDCLREDGWRDADGN